MLFHRDRCWYCERLGEPCPPALEAAVALQSALIHLADLLED